MKEICFGKVVELKIQKTKKRTKKKSITKVMFGESNPLTSDPG